MFQWPLLENNTNNGYISTGGGYIFIKTNPVVIPIYTKLVYFEPVQYVEAYHDWVGFDEDITCASVYIPIFGIIFT